MEGWIKIHRKMLENPVVTKDADHIAIWIYLLLNATHTEHESMFKGEKITLKCGQLITGRKQISCDLHIDESKVRRVIKNFETDQQIERQSSNRNSLITILNWDKYQVSDHQSDQQVTNNRPQTRMIKKERIKEKNIKKKSPLNRFNDFVQRDINFNELESEFL